MKEKTTEQMNCYEFQRWASEYVVGEFLEKGIKGIKDGLYMVITASLHNKVFGGESKKTE